MLRTSRLKNPHATKTPAQPGHNDDRTARGVAYDRMPALVAATVLLVALSACSSATDDETGEPDPSSPPAATDSGSPSGATPTETAPTETESTEAAPEADLAVVIAGDSVTPNAAEFHVAPGEVLKVRVTSDRAGELHVHSKPEQFLEFGEGTTDVDLSIDTPGTVEVEDHDTSAVVAIIIVG